MRRLFLSTILAFAFLISPALAECSGPLKKDYVSFYEKMTLPKERELYYLNRSHIIESIRRYNEEFKTQFAIDKDVNSGLLYSLSRDINMFHIVYFDESGHACKKSAFPREAFKVLFTDNYEQNI